MNSGRDVRQVAEVDTSGADVTILPSRVKFVVTQFIDTGRCMPAVTRLRQNSSVAERKCWVR